MGAESASGTRWEGAGSTVVRYATTGLNDNRPRSYSVMADS